MDDAAHRAREWWWSRLRAACDRVYAWEHGTVVRCARHPGYWDLNKLILEHPSGVPAAAVAGMADRHLAGAEHRRVDVLDAAEAARMRPGLEACGYKTMRILYMRHDAERPPPPPAVAVESLRPADVKELHREWHAEDNLGEDFEAFYPHYLEVSLSRGVEVVGVREGDRVIAFAQLERGGDCAEVSEVFVTAARRGAGLGTAVTAAAIAAGSGGRDLWISADAEDRAWRIYERLGFSTVWEMAEFTRPPQTDAGIAPSC